MNGNNYYNINIIKNIYNINVIKKKNASHGSLLTDPKPKLGLKPVDDNHSPTNHH